MFGLGLDSWNNLIVWLAALAGAFALLAAIATYMAFQLQKQEAIDSAYTFARYKLETGERIAEADARALEAQVQLAKFKSPRNMTPDQQSRLVEKLARFKGTRFDMALVVGDPEASLFLGQISKTLQLAGWEWVDFAHAGGPLTFTYTWPGLPNVGQMGAFGVDIFAPPDHASDLSTAAQLLSSALMEDGFSLSGPKTTTTEQGFINQDAIHVVIGKKPV
jgi:hypothetical protein